MIKPMVSAAVLAFALASTAQAAVVNADFDSYANGAAVTNQIAGVSFSLVGGPGATTAPTVTQGWFGQGLLTNSVAAGAYPTANILRATFDGVASSVSFDFWNAGWGGSGRGASFYSAYDIHGALVESGSFFSAGSSIATFNLLASNIHTLEFNNNTGGSDSWWFGLESLSANVNGVPEPVSLALFGIGLFGLSAMRRKSAV